MRRIYAGFMVTVLLALGMGTVSLFVLWWSLEQKDSIIGDFGERLATVKDLTIESERAARKTRAWLATGEDRLLADRKVARSRIETHAQSLARQLPPGPARQLLERLREADQILIAAVERMIALGKSGAMREEVMEIFTGHVQPARDEVDHRLLELGRAIETDLSDARRASENTERAAFFILASSIVSGVLALGVLLLGVRRTGQQIERQKDALREHATFQEQVMGIVGHDLRSPLTAVITSVELFEREAVTPLQARRLERVQRSARRIQRLAMLLLDFARTRTVGGLMIAPELHNVHLLCRTVRDDFKADHPDAEVTLHTAGPAYGLVDELRMAEVLRAMLENARRVLPTGHPLVIISEGTDDLAEIRVEVMAHALSAQVLERAFDPLRAGEDQSVVTLSAGLEMYLARQLVEGHGGTMEAAVAPDVAFIRVRLPRRPPADSRPPSTGSASRRPASLG